MSNVQFFGSQIGGQTTAPLSYTGSPWMLIRSDVWLFACKIRYLLNIVLPIWPWPSGDLDELCPSPANAYDITLHLFLFIAQAIFILSLPFLVYLSFFIYIAYIVVFLTLNELLCFALNGRVPKDGLQSTVDHETKTWKSRDDERWIFLNGVAVGKHWLQSNIDRISRTFHRPVTGVHNKTSGIIFDVIQCLIQRCFLYATQDIRDCYVLVKEALYTPGVKKVVLILHSQGGIEGGMILDWLLDEVPQDLLKYLEVYTFGNAANHFNNPYRELDSLIPIHNGQHMRGHKTNGHKEKNVQIESSEKDKHASSKPIGKRAIAHIEHYANTEDFVAQWGVLNFTCKPTTNSLENRFMGSVFARPGKGHQFNQHYLDNMFPLDPTRRYVREPKSDDFMEMEPVIGGNEKNKSKREGFVPSLYASGHLDRSDEVALPRAEVWMDEEPLMNGHKRRVKVKDLSRLWQYRNGLSPRSLHQD